MSAQTGQSLDYFTRELNMLNFKAYMDLYNSAQNKSMPKQTMPGTPPGIPGLQ